MRGWATRGHQHDALVEERQHVNVRSLLAGADGDVDLRPGQAPQRVQRVDAEDAQPRPWHLGAESRHHPRQLHDLARVGDGQRELAIGRRRIETVAVHRLLESAEGAGQRRGQRRRARGRHDPAAAADEERVFQRRPQAGQRVADRRRGDVQPPRGADDAPLGEDGVEHQEQVQIERR